MSVQHSTALLVCRDDVRLALHTFLLCGIICLQCCGTVVMTLLCNAGYSNPINNTTLVDSIIT